LLCCRRYNSRLAGEFAWVSEATLIVVVVVVVVVHVKYPATRIVAPSSGYRIYSSDG
jgi:hypothetical protein